MVAPLAPLGGVGRLPRDVLWGRPTRVYVNGWRVHHGPVGFLLAAVGVLTRRPFLIAAGACLVADDWGDRPWTP